MQELVIPERQTIRETTVLCRKFRRERACARQASKAAMMDEFERLSYNKDHIQHFQNRLEPAYPGVSLSVALATPEAKECVQEIVDAALLRDLDSGDNNCTDDASRRIITTTELRDRWLYPKDEADGMPECCGADAARCPNLSRSSSSRDSHQAICRFQVYASRVAACFPATHFMACHMSTICMHE